MFCTEVVQRKNKNNGLVFPVSNAGGIIDKDTLHIDIQALENRMDTFFDRKLSEIGLGDGVEFLNVCSGLIRRYSNIGDIGNVDELINKFFWWTARPTSILYNNIEEMEKSVWEMYQMAYCHYILGRYYFMRGGFPTHCCSYSATNLVSAFWEAGMISAVKAWTITYDHSYVVVPFVIEDQKGIILIDPTSDQLMNNTKNKTRNLIRIITQENWSYNTDWRDGADLRAEIIEISAYYGVRAIDYARYLELAFQNPALVL